MDAEGGGRDPELAVDLTTTGWAVPPSVVPLIPAMKVAVCVPLVPIRIVPDSPALPELAMSMLLEPVVRFLPAFGRGRHCAIRCVLDSASLPVATLLLPVVFGNSA